MPARPVPPREPPRDLAASRPMPAIPTSPRPPAVSPAAGGSLPLLPNPLFRALVRSTRAELACTVPQ
jgi:hypothetical protein